MRAYIAFTKKEFYESVKTYRLFIMLSVFLLLGIMNPVTAKVTPQLLESFFPEGISIRLAEPTALDSWAQFYKNVPQLGLIVLVIIFSGLMSGELSRGTLINMLTKGLPRKVVILSKFTMAELIWTASYTLCFAVTYGYTAYFWSMEGIRNIGFSAFCLWLFGTMLISITIFGGVLFRSNYGGLLFTGGITVVLMLVNISPKLQKYNPVTLSSDNLNLLNVNMTVADFKWAIIICCTVVIGFIISSIILFNRKQI